MIDVVYCLDAEGPLTEPPHDTIARLMREHGLDPRLTGDPHHILADAQAGRFGARLADVAAPHRLGFLQSWDQIERMLADLTSPEGRARYADSTGAPLRVSWFVIDLIGYRTNPRQRAQGQHAVWDRVAPFFGPNDSVGWHVHPLTPDRDPLRYGTSWTSVVHEHEASLCRRLLERGHFPASFRAGGAIERNDLSHWLERFIPFDFSCLPGASTHGMDWQGSPERPYHPDWNDYRRLGVMRRTVFPCHDADSWADRVTRIPEGGHFAFANHDRRPIGPDLDRITDLLNGCGRPWRWVTAAPPRAAVGPMVFCADQQAIVPSEPIFGEPFVAIEQHGHVWRQNAVPDGLGWRLDVPEDARVAVAVTTPDGRVGIGRL